MRKICIPLMMLCFICMISSLCSAQAPIRALELRSSGDFNWAAQTKPGFVRLDVDLNKGCGNKSNYIYLSYTRQNMGGPITGLTVVEGENAPPPPGYEKLGTDLNHQAKGAYLYLCYERGSGAPITDLYVSMGDTTMPSGWHKIPVDLNKGTRGIRLYLWYKK